MSTHYRTLGIKRQASQDEIRKAFHSLALQLHPDKPGGSIESFQPVQKAYEILSNQKTRSLYDAELAKERSKLRGFKRPPPFDIVRQPVLYKLADNEFYQFETAPDKLKCTFKHGDIISFNNILGCFIGLAADNYYYWRQDGHEHASQLCQKESFTMDVIKVIARANFKTQRKTLARSYLPGSKNTVGTTPRHNSLEIINNGESNNTKIKTKRKESAEESEKRKEEEEEEEGNTNESTQNKENQITTPTTSNTNTNRKVTKGGRMSEAQRLKEDIIRRERERHTRERLLAIIEKEKITRVRLIEKIEAALEDRRQAFRDWLTAGDFISEEKPEWMNEI